MNSKKQKFRLAVALVASVIALSSCWETKKWENLHPDGQVSAGGGVLCPKLDSVRYNAIIAPIVNTKCATNSTCHGAGSGVGDYSTYTGFVGARKGNLPTISGDIASTSAGSAGTNQMPKGGPNLSACDTSRIGQWIREGALNN